MSYVQPTVTEFKDYFWRDFPYGATTDTVTNTDIENAQALADVDFNECLWSSQASYSIGFNLLTAHYLVVSLQGSAQGVAGQFTWLQSSKSVGSVSESFQIPQNILDNPYYAMLSKTNYGARYLQLLLPRLIGQVFTVAGRTTP